jgi:outer membrane lipoprotein SlyB
MRKITPLLLLGAVAGCATVPTGPGVAVMPGAGKTFDQFTQDDRACRDWAQQSLGTDVNKAGAENVAVGAGIGTLLGAAAGALVGGHRGAGVGAAGGAVVGTAVGAGNAANVQGTAQQRYDIAYEQCMATKGNQLPVAQAAYPSYRYGTQVVYQAPPPTTVIMQQAPAPPSPSAVPPPPPGVAPPQRNEELITSAAHIPAAQGRHARGRETDALNAA